jgi:hypothetical protein
MPPERDQDDRDAAERGAPHGVTLFDHARISAELAEGDRTLEAVLEANRLTEAQWNEATLYWMKRMGDDALDHGERARIPLVYSEAFSKAQDALKPLPPMNVEGYAELVAAALATGSAADALAPRNLSNADYLRLSRHFAQVLASDPVQAKRYFDRLKELAPAVDEVDL